VILIIPLLVTKLLGLPAYILFIIAGIVSLIYYGIVLLNDPELKIKLFGALRGFKI
jgi:hypothetical protein